MNQKILLESLSMDLLRVALGLHRGSLTMAQRFKKEALQRQAELSSQDLDPYIVRIISLSDQALHLNTEKAAEDILMYSVLFQNYALKHFL